MLEPVSAKMATNPQLDLTVSKCLQGQSSDCLSERCSWVAQVAVTSCSLCHGFCWTSKAVEWLFRQCGIHSTMIYESLTLPLRLSDILYFKVWYLTFLF